MIDVAGLSGTPTASDFIFRVGTTGDPSTWSLAPAPSAVAVRLEDAPRACEAVERGGDGRHVLAPRRLQ